MCLVSLVALRLVRFCKVGRSEFGNFGKSCFVRRLVFLGKQYDHLTRRKVFS